MVKKLMQSTLLDKKPEADTSILTRSYEPEEFEADTAEERPVSLLAERRRQFLAGLNLNK